MLLLKKVTQFCPTSRQSPVLARVHLKYVVSTFTIFDIAQIFLLWLTTTIAPGQSIEKKISMILFLEQ
jgi:hypothetical protein